MRTFATACITLFASVQGMSLLDAMMASNNSDNDNGFGYFQPASVQQSMGFLTQYLAESAEAADKVTAIANKLEEDLEQEQVDRVAELEAAEEEREDYDFGYGEDSEEFDDIFNSFGFELDHDNFDSIDAPEYASTDDFLTSIKEDVEEITNEIVFPTETSPGSYAVAIPEADNGETMTLSVDIEEGIVKFVGVPDEYLEEDSVSEGDYSDSE